MRYPGQGTLPQIVRWYIPSIQLPELVRIFVHSFSYNAWELEAADRWNRYTSTSSIINLLLLIKSLNALLVTIIISIVINTVCACVSVCLFLFSSSYLQPLSILPFSFSGQWVYRCCCLCVVQVLIIGSNLCVTQGAYMRVASVCEFKNYH